MRENGTDSSFQFIQITLLTGPTNTDRLADGTQVIFSDTLNNTYDCLDAMKLNNSGENIGTLISGRLLSLQSRKMPQSNDTIFIFMNNLRQQAYRVRFKIRLDIQNLQPVLVDRYLQQFHILQNNAIFDLDFSVTNDPLSFASNRFYILFNNMSVLPIQLIDFKVSHKNMNDVLLSWSIKDASRDGIIEVERSYDGLNFETFDYVHFSDFDIQHFNLMDREISSSILFYRLKWKTDATEAFQYSNIVSIRKAENKNFSIQTNPVRDGIVRLVIHDLQPGKYTMQITDRLGKLWMKQPITLSLTTGFFASMLNNNLPVGIYDLHLFSGNGQSYTASFVIQ
jgi:hypothetical protein